jgi:probable HAF family extracellular repeat protein
MMKRTRLFSAVCASVFCLLLSPILRAGNYIITDLGTLGGTNSEGWAINASGQVVGSSDITGPGDTHAFLYDGNSMQDLGTLGGSLSAAYGINDSGQVVGQSTLTGDIEHNGVLDDHAFLYDGSSMQDLGTLGGTSSYANGINASGQVVGTYVTEDIAYNSYDHAFLYDGSVMFDLCALVDCVVAGWDTFFTAEAINDNGDITGNGQINGALHAFRVSAVPIPAAVWLFGSGLLGLIGIARKTKAV